MQDLTFRVLEKILFISDEQREGDNKMQVTLRRQ